MKYVKKFIRFLLGLIVFLLSLPFILYLPLLYDSNFYKNKIIELVDNYTVYKIKLDRFDLSVYPDLKLNLKNLDLKTKEKEVPILYLEEANLSVFFLRLLAGGKLQVDDLSFQNGFLDLPELLNTFPKKEESNSTEEMDTKEIIDLIHTRLRVKQIKLANIEIKIKKLHPFIYNDIYIKDLNVSYESFLDVNIGFNLEYGKASVYLNAKGGISPHSLSLNELFFDSEIKISNFQFYEYSHFFKTIPLEFQSTQANLELKTKKENNSILLKNEIKLALNGIQYKNKSQIKKFLNGIHLEGNINYPLLSNTIETKNLMLFIPKLLDIKIDSNLNFIHKPRLQINLSSSSIYLDEILDFAEAFSKPTEQTSDTKNNKTAEIYLDLKYNIHHINYNTYDFYYFFSQVFLNNSALNYNLGFKKLSDGNIILSGEADLNSGVTTNATLEIENINLEKFTSQYLKKKYAEGTLSSNIKLQTNNIFGEKDFLKNLNLSGYTRINKGILLERADILYPVRFLTKIIPDSDKWNGNISRFEFIDIDFTIKQERLKIKNLDMRGFVFNTSGFADIDIINPSKDINVNLIVSTRIASTGLKIPLVYSKSDYVPLSVDKVWLASTYAGMVVGGPIGAVIGSALSEKAGQAFKTIQNKTLDNTQNLFQVNQ